MFDLVAPILYLLITITTVTSKTYLIETVDKSTSGLRSASAGSRLDGSDYKDLYQRIMDMYDTACNKPTLGLRSAGKGCEDIVDFYAPSEEYDGDPDNISHGGLRQKGEYDSYE